MRTCIICFPAFVTASDVSAIILLKDNLIRLSPNKNKRAQRALGRSPEENVKGHSGANNREARDIIWTTLVEDLLMMLYIKYESTGPCSFRQDFWKFHFKTYLLTLRPTYATNWNGWNNFDRGPPREHSCEVLLNSHKRSKRRCRLKFSLYNSM